MIVVAFVVAAGMGTLARWTAQLRLRPPLGTLLANLAGSFALGWVQGMGTDSRTVLGVAGLGSLTTFSALMVELVALWSTDRRQAGAYLAVTLVGGVALAWLGLQLA